MKPRSIPPNKKLRSDSRLLRVGDKSAWNAAVTLFVLHIGLMDYFSKTPIRLLLLILFVPTLLWGYGKAIVRFAQITNNANERGEMATDSVTDRERANGKPNTKMNLGTQAVSAPKHRGIDAKRDLPQVANDLVDKWNRSNLNGGDSSSVSQTLDGELDVQTKESLVDARSAKRAMETIEANSEKAKALEPEIAKPKALESEKALKHSKKSMERSGSEIKPGSEIEPGGESATYSNRVLKPIIPVSTRMTDERNLKIKSVETNPKASVIRVLGIPTILFTGLFFVMWGIISGRIQRIMF